ncbi:MAG: hypothetical protein JSS91_02115 [Bacteroidetes bacterium]|nr:hypothetical protein [Bacteroidota bacterium]
MKTLKLLLALNAFFLFSTFAFSQSDFQNNGENENETSESIMQRQQFINVRRAGGPGKKLPKNALEKAFAQKEKIVKNADISNSITASTRWTSVNPTGMFYQVNNASYISGRTNSISFHPTDPNIFYIAAAQGGVWKTTDGGSHWVVLTDNLGSIASGDIAVDPVNPNILYYGTGELNYSGDSQYGAGIYKSTNAGLSWTNVLPASTVGSYISKIIVDPSNHNNVYCSSGIFNGAFYRSTNAGASWTQTQGMYDASSLVMDPSNSQILYLASGYYEAYYNGSKVYKSTNGGTNWTLLAGGFPTTGGRVQLAISPNNGNYVYASVADVNTGGLLGLYRTTNGGTSWTLMNNSTNYLSSQGWYDNAVVCVPGDVNKVITGGLDIYYSSNGGTTLTQKTLWYTSSQSNFSHADIHYLAYKGTTLYCCSDGGIYKSVDNATTWTDLNLNVSTLQFQSADYDPSNTQKIYGGTQDNNKQTTTNNGTVWIQRTTGDGGYTVVDPVNTNYVYGQYVGGSVQRSNNSGVSFTEFSPNTSTGGLFYNPYELAPGDHNTIVYAASNVLKTTNAQTATSSSGWTQIASTSTIGASSGVSAIGIAWNDINKIYIGTDNGRILVTTNNGSSWSASTGFDYVSDLWVDSANNAVCYASFGGTSNNVRKTTNSGTSWNVISSNLPAIGINSIVVKMSSPRTIFAGTDLGVFSSTNEGVSWVSFNTGFPNVEVYDLKYKEGPKVLLAATHGRGCFIYDFKNLVSSLTLTMKHQAYINTDTISVELRSSTSPYSLVESVKGLGGQSIARVINFATPINGIPYYIVVKHRNSIETWSGGTQMFTSNALSYNFTTASSQAYGNNMINVGGKWSFYAADVNQDGTVDLTDGTLIDNAAFNFASGYIPTDVNGDGTVDLSDAVYADNNANNFVGKITP